MATAPPGLLNLNAAKISVDKGKKSALWFVAGVILTISIQAVLAIQISKFLFRNPEVIQLILKVAISIFFLLSIYFFTKKKKTKKIKVKRKNNFFKGVLLATLNILTIPYYSGVHAMWTSSGWVRFEAADMITFVLAVCLGTLTVLYAYVFLFIRASHQNSFFSNKSNAIIGFMMLVLMVISLFRLLYG